MLTVLSVHNYLTFPLSHFLLLLSSEVYGIPRILPRPFVTDSERYSKYFPSSDSDDFSLAIVWWPTWFVGLQKLPGANPLFMTTGVRGSVCCVSRRSGKNAGQACLLSSSCLETCTGKVVFAGDRSLTSTAQSHPPRRLRRLQRLRFLKTGHCLQLTLAGFTGSADVKRPVEH